MRHTITNHPDGSVSCTVKRLEKYVITRIPDADTSVGQTWKLHVTTLVSYDGIAWLSDKNRAARRVQAAENLHGRKWIKKLDQKFDTATDAYAVTSESLPVILPVAHSGSPFLGKDKGKKHHLRRNLRVKPPSPEVPLMTPVHYHWCHGEQHACSCDTPWKKHRCGGTYCLAALSIENTRRLHMKRKEIS